MTNIKKLQFSTFSYFQTDKDAKIKERLHELKEEWKLLNYDLGLIKDATRAASKITTGETPTEEEKDSLDELKNNYPAFFDSDEDEEKLESSPSLLGKIMVAKDYIRKEIRVNIDAGRNLNKKIKGKSAATEQDKFDTVEASSSGKDDVVKPSSSKKDDSPLNEASSSVPSLSESSSSEASSSEKGETSSSKASSNEASSSEKGKSSGSSSSDDLFYNPFDDIGAD